MSDRWVKLCALFTTATVQLQTKAVQYKTHAGLLRVLEDLTTGIVLAFLLLF